MHQIIIESSENHCYPHVYSIWLKIPQISLTNSDSNMQQLELVKFILKLLIILERNTHLNSKLGTHCKGFGHDFECWENPNPWPLLANHSTTLQSTPNPRHSDPYFWPKFYLPTWG